VAVSTTIPVTNATTQEYSKTSFKTLAIVVFPVQLAECRLSEAPAPPHHRTSNAQQCRRRKGLMRHTAASCFPCQRERADAYSDGPWPSRVWMRASPERSAGRFLVREGVDAVSPLDAAKPASPQLRKNPGRRGRGQKFGFCLPLPLLPSRERATRNNADTTEDACDRAERIVHAALCAPVGDQRGRGGDNGAGNENAANESGGCASGCVWGAIRPAIRRVFRRARRGIARR
jgi:hypothetical protein